MKRSKFIATLLAICSVGCLGFGAMSALSASAAGETENNKTLLLQSGYKSGMFAPVSDIKEQKGATVEFDLYESNLKDLNYDKNFNIMSASGTSGSMSCVSFVFGKVESYPYSLYPYCPAWHTYDLTEINFGGFQYFSNGQIKEWCKIGEYVLITDYLGDPAEFMEEGYSYKVSLRYDAFEYRGVEYGGDGAWFCAERKGIFEEESEYEVLFAYKRKLSAAYTTGTMAGMEVQGLCKTANVGTTPTSADGKGHSVNMEIDNMRIYDGDTYEDAEKKYSENFETIKEEMLETDDMSILASINKFNGKNYLELPSGIRSISANYGNAMGVSEETTCRFGVGNRTLYTVNFKDKTSGEVVATQKTSTGVDFSGKKVYAGEQVYKFDYSGIDFDQVAGNVEVYGTPVSYFTMRLVSGVDGVNDKTVRVSVEGKYKLEEDILVRPDYDLLGFTTQEGSAEVEYNVGDTFNMRYQDRTLYAIWKMKSYSTVYKSDKKTLNTVTTRPGVTPFYQGATPEKKGYVFAGWSATAAPSQNQTLTANFVELADVNAENKALAVKDRLKFKREGFTFASYVEVIFDLISLPQNASVSIQGVNLNEYVEEGYRIKVSVSSMGKVTVSKAYMNSDKYVVVASTETTLSTSMINLEFQGNVVIDALTMNYDGENEYTESFEGIESISAGIYNNYYTVEGAGEIVPLAKDKVVTFIDETTGREIEKVYTYAGGNVMLLAEVQGVMEETPVWDKTQNDLLGIQADMTVKTSLTWKECNVSFVVNGVFDLIPIESTIEAVCDIYGKEIVLPTMTYQNYAIIGWTDSENGNYAKYTDKYVLTEDIELYAVWGGKPLTVEFYAEDGTTLLESQTVEYKATVRFGGEIPEKAGYKFVGWDKSTVGVTENTKFMAVYEKIVRTDVMVSVLGGIGAGRYTEGDVVTISFRGIEGFEFTGWNVISGDVTIEENNGVYTFVVGAEDVVIEAVGTEDTASPAFGCQSSIGAGFAALALLCGAAFVSVKRKERD